MIPDYYIETEINNDMWNNWEWVSGFSYQNITIPDCYDINNEGDCISQNGCTYDSMYNLCLNSFLSYPGDWWSFDMECSIDIVFNPGYVEPYIGYGDTCNELGQDFDDFVNEVVSNYLLLPLDDNANINLSITYFNYDNWETTEFCCSDDDSDICEDHYVEYNYDGNNFQCGVDNIHIEAEIEGMTEFEPCLVYDAAAYGNWVNEWDITFNGLFPYINQSTFINDILNIDQEEWEENQNCD